MLQDDRSTIMGLDIPALDLHTPYIQFLIFLIQLIIIKILVCRNIKSTLESLAISGHLSIYHQEGRSPEAELVSADLDLGSQA